MRSLPANTILRSISIYCPILFFREKKIILPKSFGIDIRFISANIVNITFDVDVSFLRSADLRYCFQVLFICSYVGLL